MRKAKELIGKQIVNQASGEQLATVRDVVFDPQAHHIVALLVESGGWFRDARVLRWSDVVSISDVIMARGDASIITASEDANLSEQMKQDVRLSGIDIMSESGERIGTVGDLYINDAGVVVGYEVKQGFINDLAGRKFLLADHVQTIGKDAIIANSTDLTTVKQAEEQLERPADQSNERMV